MIFQWDGTGVLEQILTVFKARLVSKRILWCWYVKLGHCIRLRILYLQFLSENVSGITYCIKLLDVLYIDVGLDHRVR